MTESLKLIDLEKFDLDSIEGLVDLRMDEVLPGTKGEIYSEVFKACSKNLISGHTPYQLDHFVTNDIGECVTPFGKIFQVLRELGSRKDSIMQAKSQMLKSQGRLKIALSQKMAQEKKLNNEKETNNNKATLLQIEGSLDLVEAKIWECQSGIVSALQQAENAYREMLIFWGMYQEYLPSDYKENFDRYEAREWRARIVMRAYTGRLNYIPLIEVKETEDLVKLGITLRVANFSQRQAVDFCCKLWEENDPVVEFLVFAVKNKPELTGIRGPVSTSDFVMNAFNPGHAIQEWIMKVEKDIDREDYEKLVDNLGLNQIRQAQQEMVKREKVPFPGNRR